LVFTFVFKHLTVLLLNDNKSQRETKARERTNQQVLQVYKKHQLERGHPRIHHSKGSNYIEFRRKERLLRPFERPIFPLPDLPPVARIRLFQAEPIGNRVISSMC
jgi:hypothetical protein